VCGSTWMRASWQTFRDYPAGKRHVSDPYTVTN
jgi:hypothetical protein